MSSYRVRLVLGAVLLAGCSGAPAGPSAEALPDAKLGVPAAAPSLIGVVVGVEAGPRVLLEHRPVRPECQRQALAAVGSETRVVWRDGRGASADDLRVGQQVSAWFGETELRSCPVQVYAKAIILEP